MTQNTALQTNGHRTAVVQPEAQREVTYTPRVDIRETEDELVLCADLPGVKPEDADVHFANGELVIQARCAPRQPAANYLCWEYGVGDYYRAFTITEEIDAGKITAELKNGVLTVHLPKSDAVKPRRITVQGE
jgi:HSP20 family protein